MRNLTLPPTFSLIAGASDFIHIESIVTIAGEGIRRLAEAAGLPENPRLY